MLKFQNFTGLNNVTPSHRLQPTDLAIALNVDLGLTGDVTRRGGYTRLSAVCHKNLWQGSGFMLATVNNDLVKSTGAAQTVLLPSLGVARVWYCNLPDGRTTFTNGSISGITDGVTVTTWGPPIPPSIGSLTPVAGSLNPGDYQYAITYSRLGDGVEGGPADSEPIEVTTGGLVLTGLPELAGHRINVYLSDANGGERYLAGSTTSGVFSFTGTNSQLVLPCRTEFMSPMPVGTVTALWRGRVLVAVGPVLYASRAGQFELCDMRRDFKQFTAPITLIQPVDGGVFVGTTKELAFLGGAEFDKLTYTQMVAGPVVLGSGVAVRGEQIKRGEGTGQGAAMLCIADRGIVAGFADGGVGRLTEGRYSTDVTEVAATLRQVNGLPQYIAVPQ